MVDKWWKKILAHPIERHYRNLRRTDEEALIMKQYSKEFESCKSGEDILRLSKKFRRKLGDITVKEFYKKQIIWGGGVNFQVM